MYRTRSHTKRKSSQLSPTQGANPADITWLFFDESRPNAKPSFITIPHNRFTGRAKHCRDLFAVELRNEHRFEADVYSIKFWQPKKPVKIIDLDEKGWKESFSKDWEQLTAPIPIVSQLSGFLVELDEDHVHIFVKAVKAIKVVQARNKARVTLIPLPENLHYLKAQETVIKPSSKVAKAVKYTQIQRLKNHAIYDGRYTTDGSSTAGPPIQIFHPVFETFTRRLENPTLQPTREFLALVQQFTDEASEICPREARRVEQHRETLLKILGFSTHLEPNDTWNVADSVVSIPINGYRARIAILIIELKPELGEGGSDPTIQTSLSARQFWIKQNRNAFKSISDRCCCPTFMLAGGGPWMAVLGGVYTDRAIIQRLTDMLWIGQSSTHQDNRVRHLARVLLAVRESVRELADFYRNDIPSIPTFNKNRLDIAYSRFYPYAKSFHQGERKINFDYLRRLQDDTACVSFLATTREHEPRDVVIKFVAKYGKDVHMLLAKHDYAPPLLYCGPIPEAGTILEGVPLPTTEGATERRLLPLMRMVVMEYIKPSKAQVKREDARRQIEYVLKLLHEKGYVFGDLREPNVLFDMTGKLKLIDFDWAGQYKRDIRGRPAKPLPNNRPVDLEYAHYPAGLSKNIGWPEGVDDFAPILPQHDMEMMATFLDELD
ncbi:hypothetical protein H0H81_011980 [Sphagnurus paluster]|uniref:Protein kinase domain-containing protein n=1 Tax=Sphagnurus paluster TaxID=117069 RepID=A0A9P7KKF8_9AGAR|nr:hypothetical protein H0H81_011980 [Sphagnurus paluster]